MCHSYLNHLRLQRLTSDQGTPHFAPKIRESAFSPDHDPPRPPARVKSLAHSARPQFAVIFQLAVHARAPLICQSPDPCWPLIVRGTELRSYCYRLYCSDLTVRSRRISPATRDRQDSLFARPTATAASPPISANSDAPWPRGLRHLRQRSDRHEHRCREELVKAAIRRLQEAPASPGERVHHYHRHASAQPGHSRQRNARLATVISRRPPRSLAGYQPPRAASAPEWYRGLCILSLLAHSHPGPG
ncbi:hypothetical protein FN846DRAFT_1000411 [Sphaerosporella brunnea]|uniref:Uncharacterized protein n=1 Tax=Sphaerosporella brunnea TaxID=1250544 RepID=A0A5J5EH46_9PEZI|nr:hypothetical protein FN846DRAFT_1000411 [Sphaerosporella brunnea]